MAYNISNYQRSLIVMKKLSVFKIIQLSILAVITLISVFFLLKPEVKQFVFSSSSATTLFFLIWIYFNS